MRVNALHRGWLKPGGAKMEGAQKPDLKESFIFGLELPESDPDVVAGTPLMGPNQWPAGVPALRPALSEYYDAILACGQRLMQGFTAAEGLLFVRERSSLPYSARYGQGRLFDSIFRQPLVRESDRTVCGVCLQRLEDVFINDASDPKIVPHLPQWLKESRLASFVLLPIHEGRRPFALLLAGWPERKNIGFTVTQIRQVRAMLKLVGTAHRLSAS